MIVYKFLPPERISYLDDCLLRFTQPSALNDPFECVPILSTQNAIATARKIALEQKRKSKSIPKSSPGYAAKVKEIRQNAASLLTAVKNDAEGLKTFFFKRGIANLNKHLGIFSLSRRWDSSLMWAHYTNSHQGFCVGYDSSHPFFTSSALSPDGASILRAVQYSKSRVQVPIHDTPIDISVIYTKSLDWKYEDEERLVGLLNLARSRISSSPFDICLFEVPHDAIVEIIVGANASESLGRAIVSFGENKSFSLFRSAVSDESFDMERMPLSLKG